MSRLLRRTIVRNVFIAASLLPLLGTLWFGLSYPGFTEGLLADLFGASWRENSSQYRFLFYYADYYGRLQRLNDEGFVGLPPVDLSLDDLEKGKISFHRGEFTKAVQEIESHIQRKGESESSLFWLAASWMRHAEADNCLAQLIHGKGSAAETVFSGSFPHDLSTMCALPIDTPHHRNRGTKAAIAALEKLLDRYAPHDPLYRWLLNFGHMTMGSYPDGVPPRYRIENAFTNLFYGDGKRRAEVQYADLVFRDRARELGVATLDVGKGVAVEDFDGDGYLDIVTGGTFSHLRYYRNLKGQGFVEATSEAGLEGIIQPYVITAADYDNDGAMDLFVSRPFHHFQLLRNDGRGVFSDVTFASGLLTDKPSPDEAVYTCVSAWGDIDNDGDLDLMLAQFGQYLPFSDGLLARRPTPSRLYVNQGGHFVDRTADYGLAELVRDRIYLGAAFGDYDRDGWMDLFLSSYTRGRSVLLKNMAGRRFERTSLVPSTEPGFMAAFVDVNHDGRLDLFQGSQSPSRIAVENTVFGREPLRNASKIFLQTETGFSERPDLFRHPMPAGTMGASFGDLNNDGCYDFYLGTGNPESWYILPNLMYLGESSGTQCTGSMSNISMLMGFGTIQKGHGIVFFDFDNDGDQDIYSSLGGMWPGDAWPNQLFVNESRLGNSWIKIRLRGRRSNRFGLGATIRVVAENVRGQEIVRTYLMDNGTGFGSTPYLAHIGLMDAERIREVEVNWPASGCRQTYPARLNDIQVLDEAACVEQGSGRAEKREAADED